MLFCGHNERISTLGAVWNKFHLIKIVRAAISINSKDFFFFSKAFLRYGKPSNIFHYCDKRGLYSMHGETQLTGKFNRKKLT